MADQLRNEIERLLAKISDEDSLRALLYVALRMYEQEPDSASQRIGD